MDETSLNELLECSVCLERLDATSRVLPCQHTFCRRCLEEIISTKSELRCPECRTLVEIRIEELPTNILLIRLLEGIKTAAARASGSSSPAGQPGSLTTSPTHLPNASDLLQGSPGHKASLNSTSQPCARALYNYEAKEPGDLSFKKGDLILLRKQVDENWYHGELGGQHGFFPATYVQVVTALSQDIPKCKALFDFAISDKNEKDCLTFQKDEMITVIRRVDDNWAEGKLGDRIGIFPISFVEMNDSAKWLINNQASAKNSLTQLRSVNGPVPSPSNSSNSSANSSPGNGAGTMATSLNGRDSIATAEAIIVSMATVPYIHPSILATQRSGSQKRHSLTSVSMSPQRVSPPTSNHPHRHSMELPSNLALTALSQASPATAAIVSAAHMQVSTSSAGPKISVRGNGSGDGSSAGSKPNQTGTTVMVPAFFIALYNYKPQKADEIELKKGSLYTVSEKCQDGWFKGQCMKEGKTGVFPGNYVQAVPLKMSPAKSANGSPRMVAVPTTAGQGGPASKQPHVTVNRAHSFPKTSPLAGTEFASRAVGHGAVRAPAASILRPITNVTQAHVRFTQGAAHTVASPLRTIPTVVNSSPLHIAVTTAENSLVSATPATTNNISRPGNNRSSNSGSKLHSAQAAVGNTSSTTSTSGSERNHSPRSARRSERARRGSSNSHSPSHQPTSSQQGLGHNFPSPLASLHPAMSTNASVTPPNVVIGATGVLPLSGSAAQQKDEKVRKDKREKDKLSLMKRLASAGITGKGKKSKSPPPDSLEGATASTSTSQPPATHQRSASLSTANCSEGASAAASSIGALSHQKKSGSLDLSKPSKLTKPLARERYRCIAPYPPQSDIELELKVGDVVYIHKKREDGWYKGTLQRTGKTGLFPGSFVDKF